MPFAPAESTMLFCPFPSTMMVAVPVAESSRADVGHIHLIRFQTVQEERAETVVAHAPQHGDACSLPRRSDGLICALAARDDLQIFAADGFAGLRKMRRADNEICVE